MARIIIDARKLRTSTGRYVRELLMQLEKLDKQNEYIVLAQSADLNPDQPHTWQPKAKNFRAEVCNIDHYGFAEQLQLGRILRKHQPDLVHFWMPQQPIFYRGKKVTTIHDLNYIHMHIHDGFSPSHTFKRWVFKYVLKRVIRDSVAIITPTNWVKQDLVGYTKVSEDKVHVTPEGGAQLVKKRAKSIKQLKGKQFLLYVGQSSPYKGQLRLIEALQELRKSHYDLCLAVVGKPSSYTQKLQAIVEAKGYGGVYFLGFVEDAELAWLYKNTATYVQPSLSEGFGLMNLEAMCYGAPIASSQATCLPEVCGSAAQYFDPKDAQSMARAISTILGDSKLKAKLVEHGYKRAKKYSWRRMARQTLSIYLEALGQTKR